MAKIIKNFLIITIIFFLNFIALNIHGITMEEFEAEFHKKWLYGESSEEYKIHYAAMCGYNTIIDQLYAKSNECINAQDYVGRTPLQYAISSGKFEATHFLILSGANVNICDYNNTAPLALAITKYAFLKNCQESRQSKI